eukprot:TRINITY_DN981_c3_g1_i4.p1 TRINITY_DN981_c3_g1~~TRINITY_DN981_c3_g1_i4.p1  ORF type:complete len:822 (-),score=226.92 TRINITY_DN981_c3_g1_i4:1127-3592(-)
MEGHRTMSTTDYTRGGVSNRSSLPQEWSLLPESTKEELKDATLRSYFPVYCKIAHDRLMFFGCKLCKEMDKGVLSFKKDGIYGQNLWKHLKSAHGIERKSRSSIGSGDDGAETVAGRKSTTGTTSSSTTKNAQRRAVEMSSTHVAVLVTKYWAESLCASQQVLNSSSPLRLLLTDLGITQRPPRIEEITSTFLPAMTRFFMTEAVRRVHGCPLCLSVDAWTTLYHRSYCAVTAHLITTDGERQSIPLSVQDVSSDSHSHSFSFSSHSSSLSENISSFIADVLKTCNIKKEDVLFLVNDGSESMSRVAQRLQDTLLPRPASLSFSIKCIGRVIEKAVQEALNDDDVQGFLGRIREDLDLIQSSVKADSIELLEHIGEDVDDMFHDISRGNSSWLSVYGMLLRYVKARRSIDGPGRGMVDLPRSEIDMGNVKFLSNVLSLFLKSVRELSSEMRPSISSSILIVQELMSSLGELCDVVGVSQDDDAPIDCSYVDESYLFNVWRDIRGDHMFQTEAEDKRNDEDIEASTMVLMSKRPRERSGVQTSFKRSRFVEIAWRVMKKECSPSMTMHSHVACAALLFSPSELFSFIQKESIVQHASIEFVRDRIVENASKSIEWMMDAMRPSQLFASAVETLGDGIPEFHGVDVATKHPDVGSAFAVGGSLILDERGDPEPSSASMQDRWKNQFEKEIVSYWDILARIGICAKSHTYMPELEGVLPTLDELNSDLFWSARRPWKHRFPLFFVMYRAFGCVVALSSPSHHLFSPMGVSYRRNRDFICDDYASMLLYLNQCFCDAKFSLPDIIRFVEDARYSKLVNPRAPDVV